MGASRPAAAKLADMALPVVRQDAGAFLAVVILSGSRLAVERLAGVSHRKSWRQIAALPRHRTAPRPPPRKIAMPVKKSLVSAVIAAAALTAACGAQTPSVAQPARPVPAADAQSRKVVDAADAFLATLSEAQKKAVIYRFDDAAQRRNWSNLPMVRRGGVAWGDLNPAQRSALNDLLGAVLSPQGVLMVRQEMDADDTLNRGGGRSMFGSAMYFVSFVGAPSTSTPWMLQFGGHHLGLNATVVGPSITLAPSLTGGQPVRYVKDGKPINIVVAEVTAADALMASLTPAQRARAVMGARHIDLILGPGHDGQTLQPEGLPAVDMTEAQKALLVGLIEARLNILNADDFAATMAPVRKSLNQSWFAWYGGAGAAGSYFRVTGPNLVLEFSPQDLGGEASDHLHNMYRDPTNDYGAAWTSLN
jgi:hypothetical protein